MRFLIVCRCGHTFYRSHPCALTLRTWRCPRYRRPGLHETRCTSMSEQLLASRVRVVATNGSMILKRSIDNAKLGKRRVWRNGPFKGMPLFTLTLEERATCARTCNAWAVCYGNNMPFAHRFDVTQDSGHALMARLSFELDKLDAMYADGYSVRLHILGDFFSMEYVTFWFDQLRMRRALHIYGYTHRQGAIKARIDVMCALFKGRCTIMQSDGDEHDVRPIALIETTQGADKLPVCPQQTGKAEGCLDCGLCTNPNVKGVTFRIH